MKTRILVLGLSILASTAIYAGEVLDQSGKTLKSIIQKFELMKPKDKIEFDASTLSLPSFVEQKIQIEKIASTMGELKVTLKEKQIQSVYCKANKEQISLTAQLAAKTLRVPFYLLSGTLIFEPEAILNANSIRSISFSNTIFNKLSFSKGSISFAQKILNLATTFVRIEIKPENLSLNFMGYSYLILNYSYDQNSAEEKINNLKELSAHQKCMI